MLVQEAPPLAVHVASLISTSNLVGMSPPFFAVWELGAGTNCRRLAEVRNGIDPKLEPILTIILLAQALHDVGAPGAAERLLRQALAAHPNDAVLLQETGKELRRQDRFAEACEYFRALRALRPDLGVTLAYTLHEAGSWEEADLVIKDIIDRHPDNPEMQLKRGCIAWFQGRLPVAAGAADQALRLRPGYPAAHFLRGLVFLYQDQYPEAEAALDEALRIRPDFAEALWVRGIGLKKQDKTPEAIKSYQEAIHIKRDFPEAYDFLAQLYLRNNRLADAESALRKALGSRPSFADAHFHIGVVLHAGNRDPEAVAELKEALRLRPDHALTFFGLGLALDKPGNLPDAEVAYASARSRSKPADAMSYYELGRDLNAVGKHAEVVKACEAAVQVKPDFALGYKGLGYAFGKQKKFPDAEKAYRAALAIDSKDADTNMRLAGILVLLKKLDDAEAYYRKAIRIREDDDAYVGLGLVLEAQNKPGDAETAYQAAIRINPNNPDAHESLAPLLASRGQYVAAVASYREAFRVNPKLAEDLEKAIRYSAACLAVKAAAGLAGDGMDLDEKARVGLRKQTLTWLRADLLARTRLIEIHKTKESKEQMREQVRQWKEDQDLASVRDKHAVGKLAGEERAPWEQFWHDVDALLRKEGADK
jgi:tetratricopeptide (TPR) repeat protein